MFTSAFPIISTPDLPRAMKFYQDLLDGTVTYRFPSDGEPVYVSLAIGASPIGLGHAPTAPDSAVQQRFVLWIYADDCDAAVARLRAAGTAVLEEPADQPWGERVARVSDPDGNVIVIGARAG
jgi:predicted enzyme related to lactoylglutathione lyase